MGELRSPGALTGSFRRAAATLRESSRLFLDSLAPVGRNDLAVAGCLFLTGLTGFAYLAPDALLNGDAAVYAQQIEARDLSRRTVHIGYYLLGIAFMALPPEPTDYALNLMNALLGALTLSMIYLLTRMVSHNRVASAAAALFLATNYLFVFNSVYAEVYVGQVFFLLMAFLLWIRKQPIWTGTVFSIAVLFTPGTVLAAPLFPIVRPLGKPVLLMGITVVVLVGAAVLPNVDDYLFSGRGLFDGVSGGIGLGRGLAKEGSEVLFGMFLALPFVLLGLRRLVQPPLRVLGAGIFVLWLTNLAFGERFSDVPVQLATYCLLCLVGGLGVQRIMDRATEYRGRLQRLAILFLMSLIPPAMLAFTSSRIREIRDIPAGVPLAMAGVLFLIYAGTIVFARSSRSPRAMLPLVGAAILLNGLLASMVVRSTTGRVLEYRDTAYELNRTAEGEYLVVGDWSHGILFEHYILGDSYTGRWVDIRRLTGSGSLRRQRSAREVWDQALAEGREIWLLDNRPEVTAELEEHGYTIEPFRGIHRATPSEEGP